MPEVSPSGASEPFIEREDVSHSAFHWRKARGIMAMVKVRRYASRWNQDTKSMRSLKDDAEKQRFIAQIIVVITVSGVSMSESKSCLFHMEAVGRWDHGHPYKFSYALTSTMTVFLSKMMLAPVHNASKKKREDKEVGEDEAEVPTTMYSKVMPWILMITFTIFEMMMTKSSCLGSSYGAPTTIFVVFKSSKAVFMASMSVVSSGRRSNSAQWCSSLVISGALSSSTVAEGKGGKKGKGEHELNSTGPLLSSSSESCHAIMLTFQEIAVRNYWPNPIASLSWSASSGVFLTACSMYKSRQIFVDLPDGGRRPFCDPKDVVYMMWTSPASASCSSINISSHLSSDLSHIMISKHISASARTLCDTLKMIVMWLLGKIFWASAILPPSAEAWHPGSLGSWLMIPAIFAVIYGMSMFKNGVFSPLVYAKDDHGVWRIQERRDESDDEEESEEILASGDDPFYMAAFRSKKSKRRNRRIMHMLRAHKLIGKGDTPKN